MIVLFLLMFFSLNAAFFIREESLWEISKMLGASERLRGVNRVLTRSIASLGMVLSVLGLVFLGCQAFDRC